jgi:hypothetical protein
MTRRRRLRRRLLWAGVLLGLVVVLAAASAVRVGLWTRDEIERLVSTVRHDGAFAR